MALEDTCWRDHLCGEGEPGALGFGAIPRLLPTPVVSITRYHPQALYPWALDEL